MYVFVHINKESPIRRNGVKYVSVYDCTCFTLSVYNNKYSVKISDAHIRIREE